jgi:putative membrane protein
MKKAQRPPAAIPLDELNVVDADYVPGIGAAPVLTPDTDPFAADETVPPGTPLVPPRRRRHWLAPLVIGLGGLLTLGIGLGIDNLIRSLFERSPGLGWLAVVLAALAAIALLALVVREIAAVIRIRRISHLHREAVEAAANDDRPAAIKVARSLIRLYHGRAETARGRGALERQLGEIIDGRDLVGIAENELLAPLDEAARRLVLSSSRRVAIVTAISPRAVIDLLYVGGEILSLIRRLANLYGGRPGVLGFVSLTRSALSHLAVTGGMAAGDSLVQQILGHGIAARLSARLGEGVVNGMLTARVGIAAVAVCRPLPFINGRPPRLADVVTELARVGGAQKS